MHPIDAHLDSMTRGIVSALLKAKYRKDAEEFTGPVYVHLREKFHRTCKDLTRIAGWVSTNAHHETRRLILIDKGLRPTSQKIPVAEGKGKRKNRTIWVPQREVPMSVLAAA